MSDAHAMRIALIGPAFFGYLDRLGAALRARGIAADIYDERPSNRLSAKLLLRMAPAKARMLAGRTHHLAIAEQILASGTTHVLLVSVEMFPADLLDRLRAAGVTIGLYAWDSLANKPHMARLALHAHGVASFDPVDCAAHGFVYVPLFGPVAAADAAPPSERKVDFLFCATLHSNRPRWLYRLNDAARAEGWSFRIMAFYHSRTLWLARNVASPALWSQVDRIHTRPFTSSEISEAMADARVVVDIPHHAQTGLTMRVFEALSMGAVVLTTQARLHTPLPHGLNDRILELNADDRGQRIGGADVVDRMRQALYLNPGPLTAVAQQYLTMDRFLTQIVDFLQGLGPVPTGVGRQP